MNKMAKTSQLTLELTPIQKAIELFRPWVIFAFYIITALFGWWLLAVPLAIATCLAAFVQMHDSIHHSLGFSRKIHDLIMSTSGLLLLKSGHGLQITHLRHHGRCLKDDDPEGVCATWSLHRVLLLGSFHIFTMRFYSFKRASHTLRYQVIETFATIFLLILVVTIYFYLGSIIGLIYWAVAASLSATIPLWAAYIPHRLAPEHPAVKTAGKYAQVWTPVVSSFAYHHLHHAYPKVPTALLPELSKTDLASKYKAHVFESHNQDADSLN